MMTKQEKPLNTVEQVTALLGSLCDEESKKIKEPFSYERDGVRYVGATDGRLLVLIKSDCELPYCAVDLEQVFIKRTESKPINFAAFVEFAGKPVADKTCQKCEGVGTCPCCDQDCQKCDGYGKHYAPDRPGIIGSVWFNLKLLSRGLAVLPIVETCNLSVADHEADTISDTPPLFISASDWCLILMPMRSCGGDDEDLPRFEITSAA